VCYFNHRIRQTNSSFQSTRNKRSLAKNASNTKFQTTKLSTGQSAAMTQNDHRLKKVESRDELARRVKDASN
jgi:hypothetical protein